MKSFENLINKITALINVKTGVTFIVAYVFAKLALQGTIQPGEAMVVITMVFGFYFGTQKQKSDT